MNETDEQRKTLNETIDWAQRIRAALLPLQEAHGKRVHFRPSSSGVAMVSVEHERPQRGVRFTKVADIADLATNFEALFKKHCADVEHDKKKTPEKELQSFLIRDAYTHGRLMDAINTASQKSNHPVELTFVTDEVRIPLADKKTTICDVLAVRQEGGRTIPVLLELKSGRLMTELTGQLDRYSRIVDEHADLFGKLFGAVLGREIRLDTPCEKWIVWPAAESKGLGEKDPKEQELRDAGVRCVGYVERAEGIYEFRVGNGA